MNHFTRAIEALKVSNAKHAASRKRRIEARKGAKRCVECGKAAAESKTTCEACALARKMRRIAA